jgi:hypothetical protein
MSYNACRFGLHKRHNLHPPPTATFACFATDLSIESFTLSGYVTIKGCVCHSKYLESCWQPEVVV